MSAKRVTIPVLKAWNRVFELLHCAEAHAYDREGLEQCILRLYGSTYSKSVFRGMAIPTLRSLGFILGFGDVIRISANGALVSVAHTCSDEEGYRALRAVLVEFDHEIGVLEDIGDGRAVPIDAFVRRWTPRVLLDDPRLGDRRDAHARATRERLIDWLSLLSFSHLVYRNRDEAIVDTAMVMEAERDTDPAKPSKVNAFRELLLGGYGRVVARQAGNKTVEIESVRVEVAVQAFRGMREMITEKQFDALLSRTFRSPGGHRITLGRSMGADEKLFRYHGKYYQTITIGRG